MTKLYRGCGSVRRQGQKSGGPRQCVATSISGIAALNLLLRRPGHFSTPEVAVAQVDIHADIVATVLEFDDGDTESVAGSVPDISGEEDSPVEDEVTQSPALVFGAGARAALQELDEVELEAKFITRACVMKFPPVFLRGKCRFAMRFALQEAQRAREQRDEVGSTRAWKLFLLLPRLLLHRPPRGGFRSVSCRNGSLILLQADGPTSWNRAEGALNRQR